MTADCTDSGPEPEVRYSLFDMLWDVVVALGALVVAIGLIILAIALLIGIVLRLTG